jgi:hypothetical protein
MNAEKIIAEIEWLELLFRLPDDRPLQNADWKVEEQKDNQPSINDPWPRLPRQEWLEQLFRLPDKRPLQMSDWKAANHKHDEKYASDPWFRLWKRDGG